MSRSRESRFQNPVTKAFAASRAGETRLRRLLFRPGTRFRVTYAIPSAAAASAFSSVFRPRKQVAALIQPKTSAGTLKGSPGCFTRVTRGPASPTRTTRVWSRCTMALKGTVGHHRGHEENGCLAYRPASQGASKNVQAIARTSLRASTSSGKAIPGDETKVSLNRTTVRFNIPDETKGESLCEVSHACFELRRSTFGRAKRRKREV